MALGDININIVGSGTVTATVNLLEFSNDINCPGTCMTTMLVGGPISFVLNASPNPGFTFDQFTCLGGVAPVFGPSGQLFTFPSVDGEYTITATFIACPTITIEPHLCTSTVVDQFFSVQYSASGGAAPYTWALTIGSLPTGLNLDPLTGIISGTPTIAGECTTYNIRATDANGCTSFPSIFLGPESILICPDISIGPGSLVPGTEGTPYTLQTITSFGGTPPISFSISVGSLPPGLNLNSSTGEITGTPTLAGTYNFTASANDSTENCGQCAIICRGSRPYTIVIESNPCLLTLIPPTFPNGCLNTAYSENVTGSGGAGPYTYSSSPLPLGLVGSTIAGSFNVAGTPLVIGTTNFFVIVTDSEQCTTEIPMSITIVECVQPEICYDLISCDLTKYPNITITNNFSAYIGEGIVIQILGQCYTVQISETCEGAVELNNPVITEFETCCECNPPKIYTLTDCSLQTPQIITSSDLSQYAGQTIKVCDFNTSDLIQITAQADFNCFFPYEQGYVTSITGPTSGFYYDIVADLIKPYTNPLLFPLIAGSGICANTLAPFDVATNSSPFIYTVQFFLGATPITNPIAINSKMSVAYCQYFIDQQIIVTGITITVTSFTAFGKLQVTVNTTNPVTDPLVIVLTAPITIPPTIPPTTTTTSEFTGSCICYNVVESTSCEASYLPFTGVISGVFADCICCDPPPIEPEPPYEPTIPEIDKKTYFIRESQCDIDANKTFANAMYDIFKTDAYGMESCCPRNFNQIWIQKELSDLSKINC